MYNLEFLFLSSNFAQEFTIVYENKDYFYHLLCPTLTQSSISLTIKGMQILFTDIYLYLYARTYSFICTATKYSHLYTNWEIWLSLLIGTVLFGMHIKYVSVLLPEEHKMSETQLFAYYSFDWKIVYVYSLDSCTVHARMQ